MKGERAMEERTACKSVFRDGKREPTKERVTETWIALIREMERAKASLGGTKGGEVLL